MYKEVDGSQNVAYCSDQARFAIARSVTIFCAPVRMSFNSKNVAITRIDPRQDGSTEEHDPTGANDW